MTELRRIRSRQGLSMTALALRANVSPSTLSLVERGKRPSRRTADRIAAALALAPWAVWKDYDGFRPY